MKIGEVYIYFHKGYKYEGELVGISALHLEIADHAEGTIFLPIEGTIIKEVPV